jgi:hypothetical protein
MPIRLLNNIRVGVISVYVPLPAALKQKDGDTEKFAGTADYGRDKLISGDPLFTLKSYPANMDAIVRTARMFPKSVGGVKKISTMIDYAHASAVNFIRRRIYVDATSFALGTSAPDTTPTVYSKSSLQMIGGVLDPDDRIDGEIDFSGSIPVNGIGTATSAANPGGYPNWSGDGVTPDYQAYANATATAVDADGVPDVYADMSNADGISLRDLYRAEQKESGLRKLREIIDSDPVYGEEKALRWASGLSVEVGDQPFILFEEEIDFATLYQTGTESTGLNDGATKGLTPLSFSVPVPRTEMGGTIMTFTYVKPDEVLEDQPDPDWSEVWMGQNFLEDQLKIDPVGVTAAQLSMSVDMADEDTIVMYTGYNRLKRHYATAGWSLSTDLDAVAEKSGLWQIAIPPSVTPENIVYPTDIDHYPFADQLGHATTVWANTQLTVKTPMVFGPSPVETVGIVENGDIYGVE